MKKVKKIIILFIIITVCFNCKNNSNTNPIKTNDYQLKEQNYIQYDNKEIGLQYLLPKEYIEKNKPKTIKDLSGNIKKIESEYLDSINSTSITFNVYPKQNGETIFNIKKNLFENTNNKLKIGDTEGVISKEKITVDGKGNLMKKPLELMKIDFYKKNSAYFQIAVKSEKIDKLYINKILSSIEFKTIKKWKKYYFAF